MSRALLVHVHDPRVRWSVPATEVVRIASLRDWRAAPPVDVLAALGPAPAGEVAGGRVMVVRARPGHEVALLAGGPVKIDELPTADVLPMPALLADSVPAIAGLAVGPDASMSLVVRPSALAAAAEAAP